MHIAYCIAIFSTYVPFRNLFTYFFFLVGNENRMGCWLRTYLLVPQVLSKAKCSPLLLRPRQSYSHYCDNGGRADCEIDNRSTRLFSTFPLIDYPTYATQSTARNTDILDLRRATQSLSECQTKKNKSSKTIQVLVGKRSSYTLFSEQRWEGEWCPVQNKEFVMSFSILTPRSTASNLLPSPKRKICSIWH